MMVVRYKQPEIVDAARPADPDPLAGAVRRLLHQTDLGARPGPGDRRRSGSRPAHRDRRAVGARAAGRDGFRPLPWRAQPRPLVRAVDGPRPAALAVFVPDGPVVVGIDETIERRWGPKISARGIYRDPVRSSRGHFVKGCAGSASCCWSISRGPGGSGAAVPDGSRPLRTLWPAGCPAPKAAGRLGPAVAASG